MEYPAGGGRAPSPIGFTVVAALAAAAAVGLWVARWARSHLPEAMTTRLRPSHVRAVMKRRLQQAVQQQQRPPKPAAAPSWLTVARAILRADWARLMVCVAAMVGSVACSVMLPLALGGVFDVIQARGSVSTFLQAIAFLVCAPATIHPRPPCRSPPTRVGTTASRLAPDSPKGTFPRLPKNNLARYAHPLTALPSYIRGFRTGSRVFRPRI